MANQEQLDELDALRAIYDGSEEVTISEPYDDNVLGLDGGESAISLEARISAPAEPGKLLFRVKFCLPHEYLAEYLACCPVPPSFQLECSHMSRGRLSDLCKCLDAMFSEQGQGPILFTWLEWLRTESLDHAQGVICHNACADPRATVICEQSEPVEETENLASTAVRACANCGREGHADSHACLHACGHWLCAKCIAAVMQIADACGAEHRCPLPQCRMRLSSEEVAVHRAPHDPWMAVSSHILGTTLQELIVFCPQCESVGKDIPVLMSTPLSRTAADSDKDTGGCQCRCACGLRFCGTCRSPCHPGEPCLADAGRAVRMSKRRPALPPELQRLADEVAAAVAEQETQSASCWIAWAETGEHDFKSLRRAFLEMHEGAITRGLESVFGQVRLHPAPLHEDVKARFMRSFSEFPGVEVRPAFHGTDLKNHSSIFRNGLLIPGMGNSLKVVHGAVHGTGIYTANIDAAWLSRGFCSAPVMLVCGVLQTTSVKYVMDAMVVGVADHVVPLFYGEAVTNKDMFSEEPVVNATAASRYPAVALKVTTTKSKEDKSEKFKARLARRSKRH